MKEFVIVREIGIDMGHRVPDHKSKCRSIHGHRYRILAHCTGPLYTEGEQRDMVLDFGFLKEEMMEAIDKVFDHALCLHVDDSPMRKMFEPVLFGMKVVWVPMSPTAEGLAYHWYNLLAPRVQQRSDGRAKLIGIEVFETPNCRASYWEREDAESVPSGSDS